jgi:hypothetical protein
MNEKDQKNPGRRFRPLDFLVILLCLCGVVCGVILFKLGLFQSVVSRDENPVGTILISKNIVQRRMEEKARWGKLPVYSPLYSGDQIRTADLSGATLYIERNSIDLSEKTVIRIQRSSDDEDSILIYLDEGNLVLSTVAGGGNIALNLMGRQVEAGPNTVLNASVGKDGAVVQVSEGIATLTGDGQRREIAPGTMVALNSNGAEIPPTLSNQISEQQPEPLAEPTPVLPAPVLPAPLNRLPATGHRIGIEQLKESDRIVFSWSTVTGANAYIFTLYQNTGNGRRQIIQVPPENRQNWTLENIAALSNGTFIWQVEAVNRNSTGTIQERGRIGENSFIIDIPWPGQVRIEDPGTLYVY